MRRQLLAGATAAGLGLAMTASPAAAADDEATVYVAQLNELNDSGASGEARVTVAPDGETISVEVMADGLALDGPHAMHLHGIVADDEVMASACPTIADDTDGDGVLTVLEGAPRYGAVQLSLTTSGDVSADSALAVERFPAGQEIDYERSGIEVPEVLRGGVSKLHVVVHGIDENGNGTLDLDQPERSSLSEDLPREATAPALCGTMTVATEGPVQTGAGGTAGQSSLPWALGLLAAGLAPVAMVARRPMALMVRRPSTDG